MNILVTGAYGQLGSWLRILSTGSADSFVFTDVAQAGEEQLGMLRKLGGPGVPVGCTRLDITDRDAVMQAVKDNRIDVSLQQNVIHEASLIWHLLDILFVNLFNRD